MHVDASRSTYLGVAELFSPQLGVTGIGCLMKFRYYQGGSKHSGITMALVSFTESHFPKQLLTDFFT